MVGRAVRVLHVITRLDRGGSAENTLLTVARMDSGRFHTTLAFGATRGERSPTEALARERDVCFVEIPHLVRPIRPLRDGLALWSLWRLVRRGGFDIVHTHTSKAGILGRVAAWLARVPIIVHTPHGHVFYGYHGPAMSRVFIWLERWAARLTDRIIALTAADAEDHVRLGVAGAEHFAVIHSGVDFSSSGRIPTSREEIRAELGLEAGVLVIGTLGRLTAIKGHTDLLRAFVEVRRQLGDARLVVVGDGEERGALTGLSEELGLGEHVRFAGWHDDVFGALSALDIFAFPSLNEGMGKALVEAMYMGLPCVATRVGGIPEIIEDEENGLLVPPQRPDLLAASLLRVADDPDLASRLGSAAARRARAYSVERMIEDIEALYEELLNQSKGPQT